MKFSRILVPTDFSESSQHALQLAVRSVAEDGATLTLLHVAPLPAPYPTDYGPIPVPVLLPNLAELEAESLKLLTAQAKGDIPEGMAWTPKSVLGVPADEIAREIEQGGYDLVVMGTHGRTGIRHLILGSVAERVLRSSKVPVLVTR